MVLLYTFSIRQRRNKSLSLRDESPDKGGEYDKIEKVNDLELVKLSDYFTPGKFRTIPGTALTDRGGITEMQVSV